MSTSAPVSVFFEQSWNYRNWRGYLCIFAGGAIGLLALITLARGLIQGLPPGTPKINLWGMIGLTGTVGSLMTFISGLMLWRVVTNKREVSRIDSDGIKVGSRFWRWGQLCWIAGYREDLGQGFTIRFVVKPRRAVMFWTGRPLTRDEFQDIQAKLKPFLASHFPELWIGP
jgi:hypothetical protein